VCEGAHVGVCQSQVEQQRVSASILRQSYDHLTIMPKLRSTYDRRTSNLQNILRRVQGFSEVRFTCVVVRSSEMVFAN